MIKAVIFDLDDTLISEKDYIKSGYSYISSIIGNRFSLDENQVLNDLINLFNVSTLNVFNRLLDKYEIKYTNEMILELVLEYRRHFPNIKFYEDVLPCIFTLQEQGIKLGIITDGYGEAQRQKLKALNADRYFDSIIITDELGREYWKPHPKSFEIMKEIFAIDFDEMIYIGDNPKKDFYISSVYPIKTIRILRDGVHNNNKYLENIKEDIAINNLEKLFDNLD